MPDGFRTGRCQGADTSKGELSLEQGNVARRRVIIVKALVKQYRLPFFHRLRESLLADGIELEVLYGSPSKVENTKNDNIDLPSPLGRCIPSRYFWRDRILLQWPGWRALCNSDLIILVNANRNLLNLPMLVLARLGIMNIALWGHGQNHQSGSHGYRDRFKERMALCPRWWFAYTDDTALHLRRLGFSNKRITTINNAIDTSGFSAEVRSVTQTDIEAMYSQLQLSESDSVILYCGALYSEKRIPEMLEVANIVAKRDSSFRLVIVGGGPQEGLVSQAAKSQRHLRYAGPMFGREKATIYRLSEFIFNPGLVGLAILDAFAAGRPILTFEDSLHSPEIAYLDDGENGLIISGGCSLMANTIVDLLKDRSRLKKLCSGARESGTQYSIDDMVNRVRQGILDSLQKFCLGG